VENVITLSLISHTNVGKTTLARTLLRRDVGAVLDQAHVTDLSEAYELIRSDDGAELRLWDTPGFGDTARLLKRLKEAEKPLGWFVSAVWDRFADRPLWCSQQAIRNVRDEADIVLYLVNASENPQEAAYVDMEMEILAWTEKPVIVLLNQIGYPPDPESEQLEEQAWHRHLTEHRIVKLVATLDAYARCWVQEDELLRLLGDYLPEKRKKTYRTLATAWHQKNLATFEDSMAVLARIMVAGVTDSREIPASTFLQKIGIGRDQLNHKITAARESMANAIAERFEEGTDELLALHGLDGKATRTIQELAHDAFGMPERVNESLWAALGGVTVGAAGGVSADIASGGLSVGGGTILGGIAGGVGSFLVAKGYNFIAGSDNRVRWSRGHFFEQFRRAVLAYLAVAHFGRGRGEWREGDPPAFWLRAAELALKNHSEAVAAVWKAGIRKGETGLAHLQEETMQVAQDVTTDVLSRLYPDSPIAGR
jgi:hypothetical protein